VAGFLENHIASIATFFLVVAYLPQVIKTYKTKNVEGISLPFWALINVALTCLLINAIFIFLKYGTWGYMVTEIFNEGLAFIMLIMVIKYRKKETV
jgi:uncharacterized protein with PQ loop repeat